MSMTRENLKKRILRNLGYPYVKVELSDDHLEDAIQDTLDKYIEWTAGNSTEEKYFTIPLSAGQTLYDMPEGVRDVLSFEDAGLSSGINTLFTIENYLYNQGILNPFQWTRGVGIIDYHIALDFIETLQRYTTSKYRYSYDRLQNKLMISPPPELKEVKEVDGDPDFNFAGYLLVRANVLQGSMTPGWTEDLLYNEIFGEGWVIKYSTAMAKKTLGHIRRKFSNFQSIGNTGIQLDGDQLISEANEELEKLGEELTEEYAYSGYGIEMG